MIELALNGIEKYYGANKVLNNITFEVNSGERVGLIGGNGAGKTTVFKIICGKEGYDNGILSIRKGASLGYLDQIPEYPEEYRVKDVLDEAFKEVLEVKANMRELEVSMTIAQGEELEKIMKKYGALQNEFEHKGGYEIEEKISKITQGLKINEEFMEREFNSLSGGEKTTVILGKILLQNPDILLLDEPSNHLDIESMEWLEDFLKEYKGTVFIVSHDRYFLDRVVERIIEIEDGEAATYSGNYSYYVKEKERRLLEEFEAYMDQQKKIKAMEEAIKRFRDWGSRADNPKMFKKAANMEKRIEKMNKIDRPVLEKKKIQLSFSASSRSGKEVVVVKGLSKSFDNNTVLDNLDFNVHFGEKVALLGRNGSGKSTLMKILMDDLCVDKGEVKIGSSVKAGYLEQNVSFEDEEVTVLEAFRGMFPMAEGPARGLLAKFLFYGESVFKKVKNLSGGEKTRLRLCLLMNQDINTLILDEPTNHLDIDSREMLEEALDDFVGTIIFISHDRYFINKIANRISEIKDKTIYTYRGNYNYYKEEKAKRVEEVQDTLSKKRKENKPEKPKTKEFNEDKFIEKQVNELEKIIQELEKAIEEKDREMEEKAQDYKRLEELFVAKEALKEELDLAMENWLQILS